MFTMRLESALGRSCSDDYHIHAGQLNPGDSFDVNVVLQMVRTDGGYVNWANYSEIKSMADITGQIDVSNQDVDSDPNGDTAGERAVTPGSPLDNNVTDITRLVIKTITIQQDRMCLT